MDWQNPAVYAAIALAGAFLLWLAFGKKSKPQKPKQAPQPRRSIADSFNADSFYQLWEKLSKTDRELVALLRDALELGLSRTPTGTSTVVSPGISEAAKRCLEAWAKESGMNYIQWQKGELTVRQEAPPRTVQG